VEGEDGEPLSNFDAHMFDTIIEHASRVIKGGEIGRRAKRRADNFSVGIEEE